MFLLRLSGWESTSGSWPDSSSGISTPWNVPAWNRRLAGLSWQIWVHVPALPFTAFATTTRCFGCPCRSFILERGEKCRLPHRVIRRNCVRHWRVPGVWSTIKATWLPSLHWLPILPSPVLSKEPSKHQGLWRRWRRNISGGNGLRCFKREVQRCLYQVNFIHEGISSSKLVPKFGCMELGPGNKTEPVDSFPSLDLQCYFKYTCVVKGRIPKIYNFFFTFC